MLIINLSEDHIATLLQQIGVKDLNKLIEMSQSEIIGRRGFDDGSNAATWIIDGNTSHPLDVLDRLVDGMNNGDPEIMDSLPQPRLGGEYADDPTWADILKEELELSSDDATDSLMEDYEAGFHRGIEARIRKMQEDFTP
jgi:hypothetical protein